MNKTTLQFLSLAGCLLLAGQASAQSFNLDVGNQVAPYGLPSMAYAGAAAQAGPWVNVGSTMGTTSPLTDVTGAVTTVTATSAGTGTAYNSNAFGLSGDDLLFMGDTLDADTTTFTFNNLAAGTYALYTYSWAPDLSTYVSRVTGGAGTTDPQQLVGGVWAGGAHIQGVTYALHNFNNVAAGGSISVTVTVSSGYATINGFQIKKAGPPPAVLTPFCFGDGTGTACPCGNAGIAGNGCAHSLSPNGARLAATGVASISNDTLVLQGTNMPNSSALYFQGTTRLNGGLGAVFGDGLRCAGGSVTRLGTKTNAAGASSYPVVGDQPVSIKGANVAGNVRQYQVWFRNAAAFCNAETFNLSNGGEVTWTP
jgi:hypothetical protein